MQGLNASVQQKGPAEPHNRAETILRVCLISLGGELYAVDLRSVGEVFEVESVTPVPGMPSALVGVANLRGVVIPLVDLRLILGLAVAGPPPPFAVVIRHGSRQVGVLVERVPEIRNVQHDQLLPTPHDGSSQTRPFVSAVLRLEDRLGGMLQVPLLFEQVESGGSVITSN
jgi:purine-binding chemotaxis protein CheW